MYYYTFHVGDYVTHTKYITVIEDIAYRRLLDLYYTHERPIKGDLDDISNQIGMAEYKDQVLRVLEQYFHSPEENVWNNKRCDKDIEKYKAKAERAKSANIKRWSLKSESDQIPTNNHKPITKNHKPRTNKKNKSITPRMRLQKILNDDSLLKDWFEHRNKKKAAVTDTVLDIIVREADKAGVTVADALKASIEFNWVGFKSDWYNQKKTAGDIVEKKDDKNKFWFRSAEGILAKGKEVGLRRGSMEKLKTFRDRILNELKRRDDEQTK